jgi:hypothetical protein
MICEDIIDMFRKHALEIKNEGLIDEAILIKSKDLYGFLWISEEDERLDNHCEECMEQQPSFLCFNEHNGFPKHLAAGLGKTKYQKIIAGVIKLDDIEIIGNLLE